ncbi:SDR family NAD(P)-dependent oxidoreductase [Sneathiella sp.]|uniref:SDR family NAD(P)-dependent oxidoreductase n=1 Tax=Sneathiella sp. TaxID=1964365 RepID=UPI0039E4C195
MMSFEGKVAAITGAGSGIGRALALGLASKGCSVSVSDINEAELAETVTLIAPYNVEVRSDPLDVTDRNAVESLAASVVDQFGKVDFVFNNAGVALIDRVETVSYDDFEWLMNINFWGMVYGSKAFLPYFQQQGQGHIINVSSLFGLVAVPGQSAYNASKFAIRGFTDAMGQELKGTGIYATSVHPGGIKTNIVKNARFINPGSKHIKKSDMETRFAKMARTTADQAAEVILKAVARKKKRVLIGGDARFLDIVQRLMPEKYPEFLSFVLK